MGFFVSLILSAVFFVLSNVLTPKRETEDAKPAGLGDFDFPTATEGRVVPILWGTVKLGGPNVTWYGDFIQQEIKRNEGGGIFGGGDRVTVGFRYFLGIQFALCRGPVDKVIRVEVDDRDIFSGVLTHGQNFSFDDRDFFGGEDLGTGGMIADVTLFDGNRNQMPSTYLAPFQMVNGQQNAHRGTAYLAPTSERFWVGNSPNVPAWAIETTRTPDGSVEDRNTGVKTQYLNIANRYVDTLSTVTDAELDANLVFVLFEIMTNGEWGLGYDPATFSIDSFNEAAVITRAEGNGFSLSIDTPRDVLDIVNIIEDQMDGVVFQDPVDGLWKINLTRDDEAYTENGFTVPALLAELNDDNILQVVSFSRATWVDTVNYVDVAYDDRANNYSSKFGKANDQANVNLQQGRIVPTSLRFPGCKSAELANNLAWRELRTLSYPLARMTVEVDRTLWQAQPARVVPVNIPRLNISGTRYRVQRVDFGSFTENRIRIDLVEDIFQFTTGAFAPPPVSQFQPPSDDLPEFAAADQFIIPSPRGFNERDQDSPPEFDKFFVGVRNNSAAATYNILVRSGASLPLSGDFVEVRDNDAGFIPIGFLATALTADVAYPETSITLDTSFTGSDTSETLAEAFATGASDLDLGVNLVNIIAVGATEATREFFLVRSAENTSATVVTLQGVFRGILDTAPRSHPINAPVFILHAGAAVSEDIYDRDFFVEVKLQPRSSTDTRAEADITAQQIQMNDRGRRPYPPADIRLNGNRFGTTVSLEAGGTGEADGIPVEFIRRDFRIDDELSQLSTDASQLGIGYPNLHSTFHRAEIINDPDGAATSLGTVDFPLTQAGVGDGEVPRLFILRETDGVVPTRLQIKLSAIHTLSGEVFTSLYSLDWSFDVTSALSGGFNFGALDTNDGSPLYTAVDTATHDFTLSSAFTTGNVGYSINGGAFQLLIGPGNTSGSIVGVNAGDTIQIAHDSTEVDVLKLLQMSVSGGSGDGHAILFT